MKTYTVFNTSLDPVQNIEADYFDASSGGRLEFFKTSTGTGKLVPPCAVFAAGSWFSVHEVLELKPAPTNTDPSIRIAIQEILDELADSRSQLARHQEAFSQQFEPGSLCFYGHQPVPVQDPFLKTQDPTKRLTAEQGAMQILAAAIEPLREEVTRLRLRVAELEGKS